MVSPACVRPRLDGGTSHIFLGARRRHACPNAREHIPRTHGVAGVHQHRGDRDGGTGDHQRGRRGGLPTGGEELYLAGNFAGAYRYARRAQRLFPALPGLANALAAYGVHAAAAASPDRPNWHAVLAVEQQTIATTHDAVKRQFRRLSLLVHPDKNRSAAAEGAFKILRQACDALLSDSHHHHADVHSASAATAAPQSSRPRRTYAPPQPPAAADAESNTFRRRTHKRIYCWSCKREFGRQVGSVEERVGAVCPRCNTRLWPPWDRETLLDFATLQESFAV